MSETLLSSSLDDLVRALIVMISSDFILGLVTLFEFILGLVTNNSLNISLIFYKNNVQI